MAFDTILMVDWSGGNDRGKKPVKDAIWVAVNRAGVAEEPVYLRNRQVAGIWLAELFRAELAVGRRVLAGFDFPFGYPQGFCRAVTGSEDPLELWDWFEARIEDAPASNNRFDLAAKINVALGGSTGPFWANGLQRDIAGLPRTKASYENPFPERREAEAQAKGAFTCWQMAGAGAVGSQVFMGLPVLSRLRREFPVAVWPFAALDAPIAFVEIWPSLTVKDAQAGMIKDAWQVAEVARQVSALSAEKLAEMLDVQAPEEGWIFGLGYEDLLMARKAPPLRNDCFALPPGVHWTPVDEALALLRDRLHPVTGTEHVAIAEALGRIAADDVTANRANPPAANTAVDGYGFAGGWGPGAHELPLVSGRAAAGDAPQTVGDGQAIRVLTGAALPDGVDTVVLQEDVVLDGGKIRFSGPVKAGANTRQAGEDVIKGQQILTKGQRINAPELALMAATGVSSVPVRNRLKVGILSTGSELVNPGDPVKQSQIFDANRPMLLAMATQFGHQAVDLGKVPDDREALRATLDQAAGEVDVILTSGGASAGDEDHVSALLSQSGAMTLWRIAVKPGRPLALGMWDGAPVFGLPGNPVAALVCTLIFARPAMALLAGGDWSEPQGFDMPAAFEKRKKAGRREYLRARMRDGKVEVFASEGSGRISGLSWAEGLVDLPEQALDIAPGDLVRFIPYASFGI
ncbi:gephyrin-like molybdotransferase Glp [Sulfitobacter sp. SK011]|uniref:molybdenum cofactor synthesis domain-containing protein n=1 Tax=Sulfitobacter sp. SK011 TaxID=1389004 RepID=UPI000E0AA1D9|nr:gephyrin-like molybdotransferase Glp [Sulfitobacter sp. SK011]AXI41123.1 molybdopterin molybdenumtransferase MoeA [Sulfitobacter sp. SK011]